jgi:site-specific DNA-methyltransferase (adenine-specific)
MTTVPLAKANAVEAYTSFEEGLVVCGNAFSSGVRQLIDKHFGPSDKNAVPAKGGAQFKLIICDPPYGNINKNPHWDDVANYDNWFQHCVDRAAPYATICMWGGIGKPGDRPFLEWCSRVEKKFPEWEGDLITWAKKRAYGLPDQYQFCREECFILYRGPRGKTGKPTFNIPLLDVERGYAGYNKKYPAKSKFLRRTNVWQDVTELLKGKIHPTQKPDKLYEILINTHSKPGDDVYDPCAGSGTTARACLNTSRRFCIVENVRSYLDEAKLL